MLRRFVGYGILGWGLEVCFTSMADVRSRRLRGESYLWMLPIYGAGGVMLERIHERLAARVRWQRSLAYMLAIYAVEFGSAAVLDAATGVVPWKYARGWHLKGYVRVDYAPFWYGCGWLFESLERELRKLDRPARRRISGRDASDRASAQPLRIPAAASAAPPPA